jgi:urease accessory protein UreH
VIPFANSSFEQRIDVRLADEAQLLWSDAFMAGRASAPAKRQGDGGTELASTGAGERWAFERLAYDLRVSRAGCLEFLERYCIRPAAFPVTAAWLAGGASYFGTLLRSGRSADAIEVERVHGLIQARTGLSGAMDLLGPQLAVGRLQGVSGAAFHAAREAVWRSLGDV